MEFTFRFDNPDAIHDVAASSQSCFGQISPLPSLIRVKLAPRKRAIMYFFCRKVRVKVVLRSFLYIQGKFGSLNLAPKKKGYSVLYSLHEKSEVKRSAPS